VAFSDFVQKNEWFVTAVNSVNIIFKYILSFIYIDSGL